MDSPTTAPVFWQALERLGAGGAAAADWRLLLGASWEACAPLLGRVPGEAATVIDPSAPDRRLHVVPGGGDGWEGISAPDDPVAPPVPLDPADVALLAPRWPALGDALGRALGFAANAYRADGFTRQIGTAQDGSGPAHPVVLCLPAGHAGDHNRMLADLSSWRDATVLLASARWTTPQLRALAAANRLVLVGLLEMYAAGGPGPALPVPASPGPGKRPPAALLRVRPGWTWAMVRVEVATAGRIVVSCGGQSAEYRFPKSRGATHSEEYAILFHLAGGRTWRNPPSHAANHHALRQRFTRLSSRLSAMLPLPGTPFAKDDGEWKPVFQIAYHRSVQEMKDGLAPDDEPAEHAEWQRMAEEDYLRNR